MANKQRLLTVIRRSCLTGKAVWLYQGLTKTASNMAYCRACKREIERVKNWAEKIERRKSNILRLMNDCLAGLPLTAELTDTQKSAVLLLKKTSNERLVCDSDFYEHILTQKTRREEDAKIRRQMRMRE